MPIARRALSALVAPALAACATTATAPDWPANAPALAALEVTVLPAATRVGRDGSVPVTVRVVNRSSVTVLVVGSGSCGVALEVRDAAGALAEPSASRVCTADCRPYAFAPGQAFERQEVFAPRVWSNTKQREVTLPAGAYQLLGRVSGTLDACAGLDVQTASTPVVVQVR